MSGPHLRRRMRRIIPGALAAVAAAGLLPGCAMLRDNVKGSFSCKAPGGTCAPSSAIDDAAIAAIGADGGREDAPAVLRDGPMISGPRSAAMGQAGVTRPSAITPPGTRMLRIVFLAHVDREGQLHETAAVQLILDDGLPVTPASLANHTGLADSVDASLPRTAGSPALVELAEQAPDLAADPPSPLSPSLPASGAVSGTTPAEGRASGSRVQAPPAATVPTTASPIEAIRADVAAALAAPPRKAANFPGKTE